MGLGGGLGFPAFRFIVIGTVLAVMAVLCVFLFRLGNLGCWRSMLRRCLKLWKLPIGDRDRINNSWPFFLDPQLGLGTLQVT